MLSMAACVSRSKGQTVAALLLITLVIRTSAQEAICSGDDCLQKNQSTSSQSGPLGAQSSCTPKDYPNGAKLSPVSGVAGSFLRSWTFCMPAMEDRQKVFLIPKFT